MNNISTISFDIDTSDAAAGVGVSVWLDDRCLYQTDHLVAPNHIDCEIPDEDEGEHELRIVIAGKTANHTTIDEQGNIIKDVVINMSNITIDSIDIAQLFNEKCAYTHDFNGTQPEITDSFHGVAGCNGTISFKFTTPIYLWLLENM
jgi:hypothetical protein